METVENLVVGKHTQLQTVIDKSGMYGRADRRERYIVAPVGKYGLEALDLLRAVGEDAYRVPVGQKMAERLGYDVEILVVDTLRSATEVDGRLQLLSFGHGSGREEQPGESVERFGERLRIDHLLHGVGIALVGEKRALREAFVADRLDALKSVSRVAHRYERVGRYEVEQRFATGRRCDVGCHGHRRHLLLGELCLGVERAYGVDFVAEEVKAIGHLVAVAENIEY